MDQELIQAICKCANPYGFCYLLHLGCTT